MGAIKHRYIALIIIILTVIAIQFLFQKKNYLPTGADRPSLREQIEAFAHEHDEPPEDAYIDRVWKKTPGRDGRVVNVEKSLKKMHRANLFDEDMIVYDVVKPDVDFADLEPSPIYRGHPNKQMVALMINVSWGENYVPKIIEVLSEHQVKATFFVEGKWAKNFPELVKLMDEEGHVIGNHAYNHPDMARLSRDEMVKQIEETNHILEALTGKRPVWFAPPSGSYSMDVVYVADELKMETILWTVDTIDWQNPSTSVMINRVMSNIHPGATILMHPTKPVADGLDLLITDIKAKELKLGSVSQLMSSDR